MRIATQSEKNLPRRNATAHSNSITFYDQNARNGATKGEGEAGLPFCSSPCLLIFQLEYEAPAPPSTLVAIAVMPLLSPQSNPDASDPSSPFFPSISPAPSPNHVPGSSLS
ncbi:unnamed protein product [Mortierella alpina]